MEIEVINHPNRKKVYPDHTVEDALRKVANVGVLWEMAGPKDTGVAWIVAYNVNGFVVIVTTYKEGGFEAYTHSTSNRTDETIADVTQRCCIKVPAAA